MNIGAISSALTSSAQDTGPLKNAAPGNAGGAPFSEMISDALKQAQDQAGRMDSDITRLATGKADNVHDIVLNVAEADLTFRMLMEVRDRLISSYQEIMRMQI
jgi:flagellar hook-basal body complex protein FliE